MERYCTNCQKTYPATEFEERYKRFVATPACPNCGAPLELTKK